MLYFNYFLDTEDSNARVNDTAQALDSFRVFISSEENREWALVGTNNIDLNPTGADFTDGIDEYDIEQSRYVDQNGQYQFTQELQDAAEWRQARISLTPWAGHNDIRIRFDFNTAGETEVNALELRAVRPQLMLDNRNYEFTLDASGLTADFVFDYGLVLELPGGAAIQDGSSFQVFDVASGPGSATTYTFTTAASVPPNPFEIVFATTDTAADIVQKLAARLNASFDVTVDPFNPERLAVRSGANHAGIQNVTLFNRAAIVVDEADLGTPPAGTFVIDATIDMTIQRLRDLMQEAVALAYSGPVTTSTVDLLSQSGDIDGDPVTLSNLDINYFINGALQTTTPPGVVFDGTRFVTVDPSAYEFLGVTDVAQVVYTYSINDGQGGTNVQSTTVTFTGVNDTPFAVADSAETVVGAAVTINVSGNDQDVDVNDPRTVSIGLTGPTNGAVVMSGNNIVYTPNPGFIGSDSFTYFINDGTVNSAEARVNVRVFAANGAPVVTGPATLSVTEDGPIATLPLVAGLTDPDGNPLGAVNLLLVTGDDSGITFNRATNTLTVDPAAYQRLSVGQVETVTYSYQVSDGSGNAVVRNAVITITGTNDVTTTTADTATTNEDTLVSIGVLLNDRDVDEMDTLSVVLGTTPATNGTATIVGNQIEYTPNPNFFGTDTFSYRVNDGSGDSVETLVTVTVTPVNDAPAVPVPVTTAFIDTDAISTVNLLLGATDVESNPLRVDNVTFSAPQPMPPVLPRILPDPSGLRFDSATNNLVVEPTAYQRLATGETETVIVNYDIIDGNGGRTATSTTVTITGTNQVPVARGSMADGTGAPFDSAIIPTNTATTVDVLGNDYDLDESDTLTVVITSGLVPGTVDAMIGSDGNPIITATVAGNYTLTYEVSDGVATSNSMTLELTVAAADAPPTHSGLLFRTFNENQGVQNLSLLIGVTDAVTPNGQLAISDFRITSGDGGGILLQPITRDIRITPNFYGYLGAGVTEVINFTYSIVDEVGHKTVRDGRIQITGLNDPVIANDDAAITTAGTPVTINVLGNDGAIESNDTLILLLGAAPVGGTVALSTAPGNRVYTYTPAIGFVGIDQFTYRVNDGIANSGFATVTVVVSPNIVAASFGEDDGFTTVDLREQSSDLTFVPLTVADLIVSSGDDNPLGDVSPAIRLDAVARTLVVDTNAYRGLAGGESAVVTYAYNLIDSTGVAHPRTARVTIVGADDRLVPVADTVETVEGFDINIPVLDNDDFTDTSDDPIVRLGATAPTLGTVSVNPDGSVRYTVNPTTIVAPGTTETDSFTYILSDGLHDSAEQTVTITIFEPNDAPFVGPPAIDVTYNENQFTQTVNLIRPFVGGANPTGDQDPEGLPLDIVDSSFRITGGNGVGISFIAGSNSMRVNPRSYDTLADGFDEVITVAFTITDGQGNFVNQTATVTIEGADDIPFGNLDAVTTREDTPIRINVLANDSPIEFVEPVIVEPGPLAPTDGIVIFNADNTITYIPNADFVGTDTFSYTIDDDTTVTGPILVTVEVTPVNDNPVSTGPVQVTFDQDVGRPSLLPYQVFGDTLRVFGFNAIDAGPLATFGGYSPIAGTIDLPGSNTGVYGTTGEPGFPTLNPLTVAALRGANNAFEGVYIDDVIIGFAERGEMIIDSSIGNTTLVDNPTFQQRLVLGGVVRPEISAGQYQLEIRQSADYGAPDGSVFPTVHGLDRTFDTNTPHAKQIGLQFVNANTGSPISGGNIPDGTFITLSDGINEIQLEFEDVSNPAVATGVVSGRVTIPFRNTDTPAGIAVAVRDAINSSEVQTRLSIGATTLSGEATGPSTSDTVLLHGPAAASILGGLDFSSDPVRLPITVIQYGRDIVNEDQGDTNRFRDQGQVILQGNVISDSLNFGIIVDAGQRARQDVSDLSAATLPRPGSNRAFLIQDPNLLAPGVVVVNNVLVSNVAGGVLVSGDTGGPVIAPQAFARIVNNTIYGTRGGDVGIRVENRAAPTLLNNAVANLGIGVQQVGVVNSMEQFGTIFFGNINNTDNVGLGASPLVASSDLFLNPDDRNFYPTALSDLIDTAVGSVDDRSVIESLRLSLGIASSPIIAPARDITGQRRVDGTGGGSGTGPTVFIDRGAIDRSDVAGPIAGLVDPRDLLAPITDQNPTADRDGLETYVRLVSGTKDQFLIQLDDINGAGIDDLTVLEDTIVVTEDGRRLIPGVDYRFGYSATSNRVILTPTSGVWSPNAAYEITLNNRDRVVLGITNGRGVVDAERFVVTDSDGNIGTFEYDSGFFLEIAQTLAIDVVLPADQFVDRETFTITSPDGATTVTFEFEKLGGVTAGNVMVNLAGLVTASQVRDAIFDAIDTGMVDVAGTMTPVTTVLELAPRKVGATRVQIGSQAGTVVDAPQASLDVAGVDGGVADGDLFRYQAGGIKVQFEFDNDGILDPATVPANVIVLAAGDTPQTLGTKIAQAVAAAGLGLNLARGLEDGRVYLGGQDGDTLELLSGGLSLLGTPGVTGKLELTVAPTETGATISGDAVVITSGGVTGTFLLTTDTTVAPSPTLVLLAAGDSAGVIASSLANVVRTFFASQDVAVNSIASANVITLGEPNFSQGAGNSPINTTVDLSASTITSTGVGGGAIAVPFIPTVEFTANTLAGQVIAAVTGSGLRSTAFAPGGGTVWLDNTTLVTGPTSGPVPAIKDLAGNNLAANRANRETQFTILMPGVGLDFGDAVQLVGRPGSYPTSFARDGARHTVTAAGVPRLGGEVDTEIDSYVAASAVTTHVGSTGAFIVTAVSSGETRITLQTSGATVGDLVEVTIGGLRRTYELIAPGTPATRGDVGIEFTVGVDTPVTLAAKLAAALTADSAGLAPLLPISYTPGTPRVTVRAAGDSDDNRSTIAATGTGTFAVTPLAGDLVVSLGGSVPAVGDTLSVTAGSLTLGYELILAGTILPGGPSANKGILYVPGEPAEVLAQRVAAIVEADLAALAPRTTLDYEAETFFFTLRSIDDEDGVGVGTVNFGGVNLPGVFIDPANPTAVLSFLNPRAALGSELIVETTGGGLLDAWVDFNGDGDFNDPNEQVLTNAPVIDGVNRLRVFTPTNAGVASATGSGMTWARFRISTTGNLLPSGLAIGGEVEDYQVVVASAALPVPDDDALSFGEDTTATSGDVSIGDNLAGATNVRFVVEQLPSNGVLVLDPATGLFTYESNNDFYGDDFFTYRIEGEQIITGVPYPVRSDVATVAITVTPDNDPPFSPGESFVAVEPIGTPAMPNTGNATVTITASDLVANALTQDDQLTGLPPWNEDEQSLRVVQIAVTDAAGTPVDLIPMIDPLTATDGVYTAITHVDDTSGTFRPAGTVVVTVASGEVAEVVYTAGNFYNTFNPLFGNAFPIDGFGFTIADDGATTLPSGVPAVPQPADQLTTARASITVVPINDVPLINPIANFAIAEDTAAHMVGLTGISAGVNEVQPLQITTTSSNTALIDPPSVIYTAGSVTGSLQLDPKPDQIGTSVITVTVLDAGLDGDFATATDNLSTTITFTVTVTAVNDAPIAGDDTLMAIEDTPLSITPVMLLGNDVVGPATATDELSGATDGSLTIVQQAITTTRGGTVTFVAGGNLLYTPPANVSGTDTFVYTVIDQGIQEDALRVRIDSQLTDTAVVTIVISPVNDAPTVNLPGAVTMAEDTIRPVVITGISAGVGETQDVRVTATSSNTALLPDPSVTFMPGAGTATFDLVPLADAVGVSIITVVVEDAGLDNDLATTADNRSVTTSFIVRVSPINDLPTLDPISNETIAEGAVGATKTVTGIGAGGGETQPLRVTATSGDTTLIVNPTVTYDSPDATATLNFAPVADRFGSTTIIVTVEDAGLDGNFATAADNGSVQQTFTLTVSPINDAPAIDTPTDVVMDEDSPQQSVVLTGITAGAFESQELRVRATSSNPALIANPTVGYNSPDVEGTLTFIPIADQFGTAVITVSVEDGGDDNDLVTQGDNLTTTTSFTITVNSVNDAPTITPIADQSIAEDAPVQSVAMAGITAGGGIGGGRETQPIAVTVTSDNLALVPTPTVTYTDGAATGTLSYQPLADQFGDATIVVTLTDGGLDGDLATTTDNAVTTETFVITVLPTNDAPTLGVIADQTIDEDATAMTVSLAGITNGPSESGPLRVTATSSDPTLIGNPAVTYTSPDATGTLSLVPGADQFGTAVITVTVEDGGVDGDLDTAADNGSVTQAFTVNVNAVNDVPTVDPIAAVGIDEDAPAQTVAITGISAGGGETGVLRVTASSDNVALTGTPTVTYTSPAAAGSVAFTPIANAFGNATITISVEDGGLDDDLSTAGDNGITTTSFAVSVTNTDDSPTVTDDTIETDEDTDIRIPAASLLANDVDPDLGPTTGEQLSIVIPPTLTTTLGATVTYNESTGELTYDPRGSLALQSLAPGESLQDSFPYGITDADGEDPVPTGTVFLNVAGINDAPRVTDDVIAVPDGISPTAPLLIYPLTNDTDVDGTLDVNSLVITQEPIFGSLARQVLPDGRVELAYSPFSTFAGSDSFRYTIADNLGQDSAQATVILDPSKLPRTGPDFMGGVAADGFNVDVLANDFPVVGTLDLSSLTILTQATGGIATAGTDGTISYVPNAGFVGEDTFAYTVSDSEGNVSDPQTVRVVVTASGRQNPIMFEDVNANGVVTALDALLIINRLGRASAGPSIPIGPDERGPEFYDVNGSMSISALDALLVINRLARVQSVGGEGEFVVPGEPNFGEPLTDVVTTTIASPIIADMASSLDQPMAETRTADPFGLSPDPTTAKIVGEGELTYVDDDVVDLLAAPQDDDDDDDDINGLFDLAIEGFGEV